MIVFLFQSCPLSVTDEEEEEPEPEPLEFATQPNNALSNMINETPSNFTWDFFQDHIQVNFIPNTNWSGELVLSSFQVRNGEVVNRATSDPVNTSGDKLAEGLSTEELFRGSQ